MDISPSIFHRLKSDFLELGFLANDGIRDLNIFRMNLRM